MTATINDDINPNNEYMYKMNYNKDNNIIYNNDNDISIDEIILEYENLYNIVIIDILNDFSNNFTSNIGNVEQDLLSKRFKQVCLHYSSK